MKINASDIINIVALHKISLRGNGSKIQQCKNVSCRTCSDDGGRQQIRNLRSNNCEQD